MNYDRAVRENGQLESKPRIPIGAGARYDHGDWLGVLLVSLAFQGKEDIAGLDARAALEATERLDAKMLDIVQLYLRFTGAEIKVKDAQLRLGELKSKKDSLETRTEILVAQAELAGYEAELQLMQQEWFKATNSKTASTGFLEGKPFDITALNAQLRLEAVNSVYRAHILSILRLVMPEAAEELEKQVKPILNTIGFTNAEEAETQEGIAMLNKQFLGDGKEDYKNSKTRQLILQLRNRQGGIQDTKARKGIPVLRSIPLLGKAFNYTRANNEAQLRWELLLRILTGKADVKDSKGNFFKRVLNYAEAGATSKGAPIVNARVTLVNGNLQGPINEVPEVVNVSAIRAAADYSREIRAVADEGAKDAGLSAAERQDRANLANTVTAENVLANIQNQERPKSTATVKQEQNLKTISEGAVLSVEDIFRFSRNFNLADREEQAKILAEQIRRNRGTGFKLSLGVNGIDR